MSARHREPGASSHEVCDYEGSPYRRVFWEEADRTYEDAAERLAVRALLPGSGTRLVDIGAGFGRLVSEYAGYRHVVLLDYAFSMLADARARLGNRYTYVCADLYRLPFADGSLDTAVQVRVLHHIAAIDDALREVGRSLRPGGSLVLEFANKRHAKSVARHVLRRGGPDPFDPRPHEFAPLHWNFHPADVERAVRAAGLRVQKRRAVSHWRHPVLKQALPAPLLARLDAGADRLLGRLALAPSRFLRAVRPGHAAVADTLWRCPACGAERLARLPDALACLGCRRRWPIVDGIHVFREGAPTVPSA